MGVEEEDVEDCSAGVESGEAAGWTGKVGHLAFFFFFPSLSFPRLWTECPWEGLGANMCDAERRRFCEIIYIMI